MDEHTPHKGHCFEVTSTFGTEQEFCGEKFDPHYVQDFVEELVGLMGFFNYQVLHNMGNVPVADIQEMMDLNRRITDAATLGGEYNEYALEAVELMATFVHQWREFQEGVATVQAAEEILRGPDGPV